MCQVPRAPFERLLCTVCVLYCGSKQPRVCKLTGSSGGPRSWVCFWPWLPVPSFTGQVGDREPSLPLPPPLGQSQCPPSCPSDHGETGRGQLGLLSKGFAARVVLAKVEMPLSGKRP